MLSAKNFQETHECSKRHNKDVGFHQLLLKMSHHLYVGHFVLVKSLYLFYW